MSRRYAVSIFAIAWGIFMILPLLLVVIVSFTSSDYMVFPPASYSFRWYIETATLPWFWNSLANSLIVSIAATAISIVFGIAFCRSMLRVSPSMRTAAELVIYSPLYIPSVMVGFGIFNMTIVLHLEGFGMWRMIAAHVIIALPFVVRSIWASLVGVDSSLEEAAHSLGASPSQTLWHVTIPSVAPGIIAGGFLAFAYSFNEIVVSAFLATPNVKTLPVELMAHIEYQHDVTPAAVSSIMIFVMFVVFQIIMKFGGLKAIVGR